jgi:hypothetical protein
MDSISYSLIPSGDENSASRCQNISATLDAALRLRSG